MEGEVWGANRTFLGHFGPVSTSSMAIPGTGYRILDTGTPSHRIPVREMGKIHMGPKTVKNDVVSEVVPDPLGV